jgi:hypothetical protein
LDDVSGLAMRLTGARGEAQSVPYQGQKRIRSMNPGRVRPEDNNPEKGVIMSEGKLLKKSRNAVKHRHQSHVVPREALAHLPLRRVHRRLAALEQRPTDREPPREERRNGPVPAEVLRPKRRRLPRNNALLQVVDLVRQCSSPVKGANAGGRNIVKAAPRLPAPGR